MGIPVTDVTGMFLAMETSPPIDLGAHLRGKCSYPNKEINVFAVEASQSGELYAILQRHHSTRLSTLNIVRNSTLPQRITSDASNNKGMMRWAQKRMWTNSGCEG